MISISCVIIDAVSLMISTLRFADAAGADGGSSDVSGDADAAGGDPNVSGAIGNAAVAGSDATSFACSA
jgi:hypothetical protein